MPKPPAARFDFVAKSLVVVYSGVDVAGAFSGQGRIRPALKPAQARPALAYYPGVEAAAAARSVVVDIQQRMGEEDIRRRPSIEAPAAGAERSMTEVRQDQRDGVARQKSQHGKGRDKGSGDLQKWAVVLAMVAVTVFIYPMEGTGGAPNAWLVAFYGWLSAVTTGLGALPFCVLKKTEADKYMGIANALTAGMMLAAAGSLVFEGYQFNEDSQFTEYTSLQRAGGGTLLGVLFVYGASHFLEQYEEATIFDLRGASARQVMLFVLVMTLHSLAEGVSIGVSFGGSQGIQLGQFISLSLAVHNIPEGLAVALKMIQKSDESNEVESPQANGVVKASSPANSPRAGIAPPSTATLVLVAIATSLPQPIMAVPAYLFVETFMFWLPVGLGFAGGAMFWVAIAELIPEALQHTSVVTTFVSAILAAALMLWAQCAIR